MHAMRRRGFGVVVGLSVMVFVASACTVEAPASDQAPDDALPAGTLLPGISLSLASPEDVGLLDVPWLHVTAWVRPELPRSLDPISGYNLRGMDAGTIPRPDLPVATRGGSSDWPSWMVGVKQGVRFLPLPEDATVWAVGLIGGFVAATQSAPPSGGSYPPASQPFVPDSCPAPL